MQDKRIRFIGLFIGISALLLAGCQSRKNQSDAINASGEVIYEKTVQNLKLNEMVQVVPNFFCITDTALYYIAETHTDTEETHTDTEEETRSVSSIYKIDRAEGAKENKIFTCEEEYLFSYATDPKNADKLYALTYDNQSLFVKEIDLTGTGVNSICISMDEISGDVPNHILIGETGDFILWRGKTIYFAGHDGNIKKTIVCPNGSLQSVVSLSANQLSLTYYSENNKAFLCGVQTDTGTFLTPAEISSSVILLSDEKQYLWDSNNVYLFNEKTKEAEKCLHLSDYALSEVWTRTLRVVGESIEAISYSEANANTITLVTLTPREKLPDTDLDPELYDASGKRIIKIYSNMPDIMNVDFSQELLDAFALQSTKYTVRFYEGTASMETIMNQKNPPDIIYEFMPISICSYAQGGYLEDLWPYIDKSDKLKRTDLYPGAISFFTENEKLYGLPTIFYLHTLLGVKSQMPEGGWNTEEFIEWISENPDFYSELGFDQYRLLDCCMEGNLDAYVDFNIRQANFCQEKFIDMLNRIKKLDFSKCQMVFLDIDMQTDVDFTQSVYLNNSYLANLDTIGIAQYVLGDELINMGIPNDKRERKVLINTYKNFGIVKKSTCKEGAYEFIEFCLLYGKKDMLSEQAKGRFWTVKSMMDEEMEYVIGDRVRHKILSEEEMKEVHYPITERDKELVEEMIENAVPDHMEAQLIRNMIMEETQGFFAGQMSAEEVAGKIQSRVQLFLDENSR